MNQQEAFDILKLGHNVYLTGSAGSGKTFLLNQYIDYMKSRGAAIGATASTGIAATHIKGMTIHSWSGIGIKNNLSDYELRQMVKKRFLVNRLTRTQVLVIDEISMLQDFHLDLVDEVCRSLKQNHLPFGGLQVVLCGDLFQLPPVRKNGEEARFITRAKIWNNMNLRVCYLDEQYRYKDDQLVKILNEIRSNNTSEDTVSLLNSRISQTPSNFFGLTKLYTHNIDVDRINNQQLASLPGPAHLYRMQGRGLKQLLPALQNSCLAPQELYLKKGAAVMFVKNNFEQGYVNGTLGQVVDFDPSGFPVVQTMAGQKIVAAPVSWFIEEEGIPKAEVIQVPLRLAWAITVHKSQGMSLDGAEIDLTKTFEKGMGYVALSRVRSLHGIKLMGLNELALRVNEEVVELDKELQEMSQTAVVELNNLNQEEKEQKQQNFLESIGADAKAKKRSKKIPGATYAETKSLVLKKLSIKQIANRRGITEGTVMSHLEKLLSRGEKLDLEYLKPVTNNRFIKIQEAFEESGGLNLSPVKEILGDDFSYDELRLARLFIDFSF